MDTSYHGLSRRFQDLGAFAIGLTGIKNGSLKCLFIFKWNWRRQGFWVSAHKNLKSCREHVVGLYLETYLQTYIDVNFILVLMWGNHFRSLSKYLSTPCILTTSLWSFKAYQLLYVPPSLTSKNCTFNLQNIFMCFVFGVMCDNSNINLLSTFFNVQSL
jgi:hypothetical protein